jgi:excisionase family DNA binding protein
MEMSEDTDDIRWMTVEEASKHLRITRATLYTYMKEGKLPFYYLAGTRNRRLKRSDVDALLVPGKPEDVDSADDAGG